MSDRLQETYELRLPADLELVPGAVARIANHLKLFGLDPQRWTPLELALVEAINNAIIHGCRDREGSQVVVRIAWNDTDLDVRIQDPGFFEPDPSWGELPADLLSENGRGGFLICGAFDQVEHLNDEQGHTLRLSTDLDKAPRGPANYLEAFDAVEKAAEELETSYETVAGLRFLVSLLAASDASSQIVGQALGRLNEIDDFAFACVRVVKGTHLELQHLWGNAPEMCPRISLGDDCAETRTVLTLATQRIASCDSLEASDPLKGAGGPAVVVPVCYEDERIGTITLVRNHEHPFFRAGTIELVHTVAEFLGVAWASDRMQARQRELEVNQHELTLAAQMQARLLPEAFPQRRDLDFSGSCMSARAVGGDFYDVFEIEGGTVLVIADAMGKGVPAAFVATVLRCAIRAREHLATDPGRLLTEVNRQITTDLLKVDIFITALVAFIPDNAERVLLSSAGHCPALLRRREGEVESVESGGPPLGVLEDAEFPTHEASLNPGDAMVFVTDGVYEVGPQAEALLGLGWLCGVLSGTDATDAHKILERIVDANRARAAGEPAQDDRTLLVCSRATVSSPHSETTSTALA